MINFWDFNVWGSFNIVAVLLLSLLAANVLKKSIRILEVSLIPSSVIGGIVLVIIAAIYKVLVGRPLFEEAFFGGNGTDVLEIITYHCLALGFIASTLRTTDVKKDKERTQEIFNTGVTTVSTYLLQGILGVIITILLTLAVTDFFPAAGILLPFGFGQGTGQAMNYGSLYETDYGFSGGRSFGLMLAALGFISSGIGGVLHLNLLRRKGKIKLSDSSRTAHFSGELEAENEIPLQENMDKMTVQIALIAIAYFLTYLLMLLLGKLIPSMQSMIYGFNFLLGVLMAVAVKGSMNFLRRHNRLKRQYTNNFLLTRTSNFFFDIMVVSGIAAIRLTILENYWWILLLLALVGAVSTYFYNHFVAVKLFPDYAEEQFLMMYGMLTGTASTGIILLREADGNFETPVSENIVYQNFPAIVLGFPMMLVAAIVPKRPYLSLVILILYFTAMNLILFRKFIFKKKKS